MTWHRKYGPEFWNALVGLQCYQATTRISVHQCCTDVVKHALNVCRKGNFYAKMNKDTSQVIHETRSWQWLIVQGYAIVFCSHIKLHPHLPWLVRVFTPQWGMYSVIILIVPTSSLLSLLLYPLTTVLNHSPVFHLQLRCCNFALARARL